MGLTVVPVSSGNTLRQILLLQDFRPQGLACTPSFALHIGESMREQGLDPRGVGLRYGLFGAEPWTDAMRLQLEALWGIVAVDFYGLSEIIGPGVAVECAAARRGLHIAEDHFLPEVIDPASGEPRPAGAEGELVLTCLTKQALPMIRYRTGDVTALDPEPCRCGRTSIRMARIKGRSDDMLVIKGVNVYPSQLEAALLTVSDLAPHYQLVVDRSHGFPIISVHVEPTPERVSAWGGFDSRRPEVAALAAAGGRAPAGAPGPQPRSGHRPAQDHPAQRGEGGAGRGKESTMSQRVTEAELLARIERGERVESAEEMTEAYRDNLVHLMTMQADSELAGGYGYVPWIMKAPGVDEKHVVAQIVKDEHRHASVMYGLLADLGVDVDAHVGPTTRPSPCASTPPRTSGPPASPPTSA